MVLVKRQIADTVQTWNGKIAEAAAKKKDERTNGRKGTNAPSSALENDGYITEDTASESQLDDLSPVSADYNAIDAIQAEPIEVADSSDGELQDQIVTNPDDIVVIQGEIGGLFLSSFCKIR